MGREAQVWKKQKDLTKIVVNQHPDALLVQEQLKVRIALHTIRKACVEGSEIEKERTMIENKKHKHQRRGSKSRIPYSEKHPLAIRSIEAIQEEARHNVNLNRNRLKLERESSKLGKPRPIFQALIAEIRADQYKKFMSKAKRLGKQMADQHKLAPIAISQDDSDQHKAVAGDGKHPHRVRPMSAPSHLSPSALQGYDQMVVQEAIHLAHSAAAARGSPHDEFDPNFDFDALFNKPSEIAKRQLASRNNSVSTSTPAGSLIPVIGALNLGGALTPLTAASLHAHAYSNNASSNASNNPSANASPTTTTPLIGSAASSPYLRPPLTSGPATPVKLDEVPETNARSGIGFLRQISQKGTLQRSNTRKSIEALGPLNEDGSPKAGAGRPYDTDDFGFGSAFVKPSLLSMKSYKSSFSLSTVENDDKIQKVQRVKEDMMADKEAALRRKIQDREDSAVQRTQLKVLSEKQRAWLGVVSLMARLNRLRLVLVDHRAQVAKNDMTSSLQRAIALIEKWWQRKRITMKLKRHPFTLEVFRRYMLRWFVRERLRRKKRSSALLLTFLQDSTGISESMRKIYKYRQRIVKLQRFVRSWLEIQYSRVQVLWLHAENISRRLQKQERIEDARNERESMKSLSKIHGFNTTVDGLNEVKRKIGGLLKAHEEDKRSRELRELEQAEALRKAEEAHREALMSASAKRMAKFKREQGLAAQARERRARLRQQIPWHRKIRAIPENVRLFKLLQGILHKQRRRHLLNIDQATKRHAESTMRVDMQHVQDFLRDPTNNHGAHLLSQSIVDPVSVMSTIKDRANPPFLLFSKGGLDSVEVMLLSNKDIRYLNNV